MDGTTNIDANGFNGGRGSQDQESGDVQRWIFTKREKHNTEIETFDLQQPSEAQIIIIVIIDHQKKLG
ncbi:hypothetical protein QVD17_40645 [Tagetes erecta]|uniref:Uncharacterized protein n=1 Tax=Tagetes erecta TaxID=13708 RepID=A0AAD8JW59_TARER|nr:hypothetical protein QVD17_40645 [Tagetes erecta]